PPWADVLASIEDGVIVLDYAGRITDLNPAAEQLTGIAASQAVGAEVGTFFRTSPWVGEMARGTLVEGAARRRGEGMLATRGHEVPVSAACAPVVDAEGRARGAVLVLHDLTLQHTLEATTRRADRLAALGTVASGLAHEIKNPLGGIKGAAQLLRGGTGELLLSTRLEARFHIRRRSGRGRFLSVLIEDTGPGISAELQAQLFSPFFST